MPDFLLINDISKITRTRLVNVFNNFTISYSFKSYFIHILKDEYLGQSSKIIDQNNIRIIDAEFSIFIDSFEKKEWYFCFDVIEIWYQYLVLFDNKFIGNNKISSDFLYSINRVLEETFSGYRLLKGKIVAITDEIEINAVKEAVSSSSGPVAEHMRMALEKFSAKPNPDYRNAIKEAISAVEALVKKISKNQKDSLGPALDGIENEIGISGALKEGFKKIYGYTSQEGGIRHALTDESVSPTFEDAKYMIVSCSAFINYLSDKARKAGLL